MERKSRPLKTAKGELIKTIDQRILEQELLKKEINCEMQRHMKACQQRGSITGIDYSQDKIQNGALRLDFKDALRKIDSLQKNLNKVIDTLSDLRKKRKKLIEMYRSDKSLEAQVFYYREVLEYSQDMTAVKIGYSTRQIQRIEKRLREKYDG